MLYNPCLQPVTARKSGGLTGEIHLPGDKSIAHRAVILGAIASGETRLTGMPESEDVLDTCKAMQAMGAKIHKKGSFHIISGVGVSGLQEPQEPLDLGNCGTGARLIMGLVGTQEMTTTFQGDASLSRRPMERVLDPLRCMGTHIVFLGEENRIPLRLKGPKEARAISFQPSVASAQVKSAILLAGLNTYGTTIVTEPIKTRDHTERMLKMFGAQIKTERTDSLSRISIQGKTLLHGQEILIPGDPSSAAFFIVAALIVPDSYIILKNVLMNPSRTGLIQTLQEMGANIGIKNFQGSYCEEVADLHIKTSPLQGTGVPSERAPSMIDEYPVLSIAASFAQGTTVMQGLQELRVKESDRLSSLAKGLKANGVLCHEERSSLTIIGNPGGRGLGGKIVETHLDHRIAMSFLVMGLATQKQVTIDDASVIRTSFPEFTELMKSTGAQIFREPHGLKKEYAG